MVFTGDAFVHSFDLHDMYMFLCKANRDEFIVYQLRRSLDSSGSLFKIAYFHDVIICQSSLWRLPSNVEPEGGRATCLGLCCRGVDHVA